MQGLLICKDCGEKMVRNTAYYTNELKNGLPITDTCVQLQRSMVKRFAVHLIREDVLKEILLDVIDTLVSSMMNVAETISKAERGKLKKQIGILENQLYV